MAISFRDLITVLHGMGFGALFMLAFSGAIGLIYASSLGAVAWETSSRHRTMYRLYLVSMAALAWLTVLSGVYFVYPWYRAAPPPGVTDLTGYPRSLLLSSPLTAGWHDYGMEWKEQVAWLAPISMTMVAYLFLRYGPTLRRNGRLRAAALGFTLVAFAVTGVAGMFGAFLNKFAPVRGGPEIILMRAR